MPPDRSRGVTFASRAPRRDTQVSDTSARDSRDVHRASITGNFSTLTRRTREFPFRLPVPGRTLPHGTETGSIRAAGQSRRGTKRLVDPVEESREETVISRGFPSPFLVSPRSSESFRGPFVDAGIFNGRKDSPWVSPRMELNVRGEGGRNDDCESSWIAFDRGYVTGQWGRRGELPRRCLWRTLVVLGGVLGTPSVMSVRSFVISVTVRSRIFPTVVASCDCPRRESRLDACRWFSADPVFHARNGSAVIQKPTGAFVAGPGVN